jgi:cell division protein FtsB|tara:strand:- start:378 stop:704 length:327 start_codon:yes stop_codon:yes gene_type:complete
MYLLKEFRTRVRFVVGPLLGVLAISYFTYHVANGNRGLIAWWKIKQRTALARKIMDSSDFERKTIEHRVSLLKPNSLDPDMLEERAMFMLNYGYKNDIVILEEHKRRK